MSNQQLTLPALLGLGLLLSVCIPGSPIAQSKIAPAPISKELVPYLHARSIINFSQRELIEFVPELKNIEFAQRWLEISESSSLFPISAVFG